MWQHLKGTETMKFIVSTLIVLVSLSSFAQKKATASKAYSRPYGMAGCGLGAEVVGKEGGQVFAATTNGSFYNQLFGITSETLGCVDDNMSQVAHRSDVYIQYNKYALQGDIAQGQGETLAAYSTLLGCSNQGVLGQALKSNFESIFSKENNTPNEITDSIITVIQQDQKLTGVCQLG